MEVQEGLKVKKSGHCLAHDYAFVQGPELSPLGLLMTPAQCCYVCAKSLAHSEYSVQDNLSWPL